MSPNARQDAQALLDALPLPSYIYDLETGQVLGANSAFCSLLEYALENINSTEAANFYAADERDAMRRQLRTLPPQGTGERRFQTQSGQILVAKVRYRNTELMNVHREFISAQLVVLLAHQVEPAKPAALEK